MRREVLIFFWLYFICYLNLCIAQENQPVGLVYHSAFEQNSFDKYFQQQADLFQLLISSDETMTVENAEAISNRFDCFVNSYKDKYADRGFDHRAISKLFYKAHRKFLKRYTLYSTLGTTLNDGGYDCLSGTALYALIFDELRIKYEVIETNYHIYLKVYTKDGPALLESTDPLYGFIDSREEVERLLNDYDKGNTAGAGAMVGNQNNKALYEFNFHMNQAVGLYSLVGLQYYNMAVDNYNNEKIEAAVDNIEKAVLFYNSERITEFSTIVRRTVLTNSTASKQWKENLLERINRILSTHVAVASR